MLRQLVGVEKAFANQNISSFVQFSIRVNNQAEVKKAVNNFKKILPGLRLKVENGHFARASEEDINNSVIRLPMWIQVTNGACHFMDQFNTSPITNRLTTIAYNDHIVVVNTNRALADNGFIRNAIEHALDDDILSAFKSEPDLTEEEKMLPIHESAAFKEEIERAERNKPELHPNDKLTSFPYDINDPHLVNKMPVQIHLDSVIPFGQLTCFDKKSKEPKQLDELMWTAIAINQNAMAMNVEGNSYKKQPLSLRTIVDVRKYADDQSKINWRNANCSSIVNLLVNPSDDMKLSDILNLFRSDLNNNIKDKSFYWINNGNLNGESGRSVGRYSSVGAVEIKKPILDFFIQETFKASKDMIFDHKNGIGLNVFSFCKVTPKMGTFCPTVYFTNTASFIRETVIFNRALNFFITKIPIDTKYKEALNEIQHFQKNLLDN